MRKKRITRSALSVSVILLIVWTLLGTGSTIAWFQDTDEAVNSFKLGTVNLEVYHKTGGSYAPVDETTEVFDDEALYEPGYTQVVYLKIRNAGDVVIDYRLSVIADSWVDGTSVTGKKIHLPDHLKFGVVVANSEEELATLVGERVAARAQAQMTSLNKYDETHYDLVPAGEQYAALIVYMPEDVGNEANYRGDAAPSVDLGIHVRASQRGSMNK